jgi:hypothetical protein
MKDRFGKDWTGVPGTFFWKRPQMGRRMFFQHIATAVGGYFLLPSRPGETIARAGVAPRGTAKNVIFILLTGAPSHTDTFDLKEGAWTPAFMAPTSYGDLRFPQGLMPNLASQIDSIAFVRSILSWSAVHSLSQTWLQIGRNPVSAMGKISPHIGSIASIELRPQDGDPLLPTFLSLNAGGLNPENGYLPTQYGPFYVNPNGGGLANTTHRDGAARFDQRYGMLQDIDVGLRKDAPYGPAFDEMVTWNVAARKLMYNSSVDKIFTFTGDDRTRYGNSNFGNACVTARNLLRARAGTRFIQISFGSWDNHANIYQPNATLQSLTRQFDNGLGNLMNDLRNDGLLDQTLIVAMGEFGRTVGPLNVNGGRDHHVQQAAMFAGAGIKGGRAIGSTDALGRSTSDPGWSRQRDVRPEDIEATIYSALGIDWTTTRHDDPLGRGFDYVPFANQDLYGPIDELWG